MAYLRLLRQSDLRTIQNAYVELFQLQAPSRRALEDALASRRWLSLAAVCPDLASSSREEYMGGFVMSVVATVEDFHTDLNYYNSGEGAGGGGPSTAAGETVSGPTRVGVQATGLERVGLPLEQRAVNICMLGVLPSYRRRGLARLMLRQVVDSARTASACAVFLHVRPSNTAALALYQSAGFVPTALLPDYYDAGSGVAAAADTAADGAEAGAADAPRTAGGDAVLLVMPLTETAAAAVAAAAAGVKEAVAAAITTAAATAALSGPRASAVPSAVSGVVGGGDVSAGTGTAASGSDPTSSAASPQRSSRFAGQSAPTDPEAVHRAAAAAAVTGNGTGPTSTTSTTASSTSSKTTTTTASSNNVGSGTSSSTATTTTTSNNNSSNKGRSGTAGGLFGILAAAAAGAVDGLSVLLPGRARAGTQAGDPGVVREVQLGGEVLMEERGPDGEVYLRGGADAGGDAGSSTVGVVAEKASGIPAPVPGTKDGVEAGSGAGASASVSGPGSVEDAGGDGGPAGDGATCGRAGEGVVVPEPADVGAAVPHPHMTCRAVGGGRAGGRRWESPPALQGGCGPEARVGGCVGAAGRVAAGRGLGAGAPLRLGRPQRQQPGAVRASAGAAAMRLLISSPAGSAIGRRSGTSRPAVR